MINLSKSKIMTVRKRLMLFFSFAFILLLVVISSGYYLYNHRKNLHHENEMQQRKYNASVSLQIHSETINKTVEDYTIWDEFDDQLSQSANKKWFLSNIDPLLETLKINYLFIFKGNGEIFYQLADSISEKSPIIFNPEIIHKLFDTCANSKKQLTHFFIKSGNRVIEFSGATIHRTIDVGRVLATRGIFLIGEELKQTDLKKLGIITNAQLKLSFSDEILKSDDGYTYKISENLLDYDRKCVGKLIFTSKDEFNAKEEKYETIMNVINLTWVILVLVLGSFLIQKHVSHPLVNITKSLKLEDIEILRSDFKRTDEFGKISMLIKDFFEQKQTLNSEIEERRAIQEELEKVNQRLFDQNYEIMVNNNILQQQKEEMTAQAEMLEKINSELEKLTLAMSKSDNSVVITDANGDIVWHNDGLARMLEVSPDDFYRFFGTNIFNKPTQTDFNEIFLEAVDNHKSAAFSYKTQTQSGKDIWLQTTLTPVFDEENVLDKIIAIDSDITIIKQAEQKIAQQSENITNSLNYAKRIQKAIFPPVDMLAQTVRDYFIILKPRDIVSGDFFWFLQKDGLLYLAAADCTGHGVPGAFMSVLGISFLNQVVANSEDNLSAGSILDQLRDHTINALHLSGNINESKDGMNISLCIVDFMYKRIQFAGAHNSILQYKHADSKSELIEHEADKMPIGISKDYQPYTNKSFSYENGDIIYLYSDGYYDQFGGSNDRKFLKNNFKKLLLDVSEKPLSEQKEIIQNTFNDWKGNRPQIDDILVMGIKI